MTLDRYISAVRAVVAKEMVRRGFSVNEAARLLGVTAAAVSLYASGKRGGELAAKVESDERIMSIIRSYVDAIAEGGRSGVLDLTDLAQAVKNAFEAPSRAKADVTLLIMERIKLEQETAVRSMALAYRSANPLARSLFMQIAMDSMRHAEILTTILDYLAGRIKADEIALTEEELRAVSEEERGMRESLAALSGAEDPLVRALIKSIEFDELKHYELVKALIAVKPKRPRSS
ncbi:MAG: transcriptional regulator [Thermoproteus sp.]|uniref:transcriptional regulator n=1 Tax=Thermoproteus sp. CP80 TaxID=1650659 RepID=UPI0009C0CA4D|nr:transcriptional regulator [Thermoproteus sp. CP80]MDT7870731.1 transcriptional regulator [Thermoproteus sp.]MDT7883123.1 transcriptional regulator [Thermoproteus sp.]PLC61993.1 transcriptional regulator [Thermoproteus sp. CP80]